LQINRNQAGGPEFLIIYGRFDFLRNDHEADIAAMRQSWICPDLPQRIKDSDKCRNRRKVLRSVSYNGHEADLDWLRSVLQQI